MAEDNKENNISEIIEKFCSHLEGKLDSDKELSDEDKDVLRAELGEFRGITNEMSKFIKEYPNLSMTFASAVKTLHEHEQKLELLKDCLVSNGMIMQVEAKTEEEAVELAKKTLEEEVLADMLANVDKTTIH